MSHTREEADWKARILSVHLRRRVVPHPPASAVPLLFHSTPFAALVLPRIISLLGVAGACETLLVSMRLLLPHSHRFCLFLPTIAYYYATYGILASRMLPYT